MIDMLAVEERIGAMLSELVLLHGSDGSSDFLDDESFDDYCDLEPCDDDLLSWPVRFTTPDSGVECSARLYERVNGTVALCIEAFVIEVADVPEVHRWLTTQTGHMPFVHSRCIPGHGETMKVHALHSLLADYVTTDVLRQVLGSIDYVVGRWARSLRTEACGETPSSRGRVAAWGGAKETDVMAHGGTTSILAELDALVGLADVKAFVRRLIALQEVAGLRRGHGLRPLVSSPHLVFTGNPGTGKTTVARLIGRLYREVGVLSKGHVVEVDRAGLIAGYVGQTALKTKEMLEKAEGGVLFIDEAYSLANDGGRDYGDEAIQTILAHMENNRGDFALVVAGYPDQMGTFLRSNPGLASRFDHQILFPDFSVLELESILATLLAEHDYEVDEVVRGTLREVMASWPRGSGFGNGREVRRLFHEVVSEHSAWVVEHGITSGEELRRIVPEHLSRCALSVRPGGLSVAGGYI